jgi:hypothetical protein
MKIPLALATLIILTGCATQQPPVNREEITMEMAGPAPTVEEIKSFVAEQLKDPESARFRYVRTPFKCYLRGAPITGGKIEHYGWCSHLEVAGKNSYGAYIGYKEVRIFAKNSRMITYTGNLYFTEPWLKQ